MAKVEDLKVIVISDSQDQQQQHQDILSQMGIEKIESASTGNEALAKLRSAHFDLVISHWQIADMEGYVLMQKVKSLSNYYNVPYIVCSEELSEQDQFLATEFGVGEYIKLPISAENYPSHVLAVLGHGQEKSELDHLLDDMREKISKGQAANVKVQIKDVQINFPDNLNLLDVMGDMHMALDEFPEAVDCYRKVTHKSNRNIVAINKLAKALLKNKDIMQAIAQLERLRLLSPNNIERLTLLGNIYLDHSETEKAEGTFEEAVAIDPENQNARDGMGKVLVSKGNYSQAFGYLKSTEKAEEIASYLNNLGIALVKQERYKEAKKLYVNALQMLPGHSKEHVLLFNIGLALKKENDLKAAASFFKATLIKDHSFNKAKVNLKEVFPLLDKKAKNFNEWVKTIDQQAVEVLMESLSEAPSKDD